jgi:hypothetical protein
MKLSAHIVNCSYFLTIQIYWALNFPVLDLSSFIQRMPSPEPAQDVAFVPFTKAERIRQLNDIDKVRKVPPLLAHALTCAQSITQLLKSAGLALQILAASQESSQPVAGRKEAFKSATDNYLSTLHSVDLRLRRQIWGLEEADIIIDKKTKDSQQPKIGGDGKPEKDFEGGTGKLDIGWLNSRSGKVGRDNEAELWAKARTFLEGVNEDLGTDEKADGHSDQDMDS